MPVENFLKTNMPEVSMETIVVMLKSLEDKLDIFISQNSEEHKEIKTKQDYTNGNVRRLQIWQARIMGAITVIVFIMGFFIPWVLNKINNSKSITEADIKLLIQENNEKQF